MEQILGKLGDPGRYHILLAFLFAITWWSITLGTVSMAFYGYIPQPMVCDVPPQSIYGNMSNQSDHSTSIHRRSVDDSMPASMTITVSKDQCSYNITDKANKSSSTFECTRWTYGDEGRGTSTIATEWNLVCSEKYYIALSNTIFFVGVFFGALIFGIISDHLGRKKTLAICLYTQIPISLAIAFMPDIIWFTIVRFFLGVWLQGISTVAFVHCIEFFKHKYRGLVMVAFGTTWAFGQLLTALFAYVFPNWRHMQAAAAALALFTLPYFWWLPESPRWLIVKGRCNEVVKIFLTRAVKMNKLNAPEILQWSRQRLEEIVQQQSLAVPDEHTPSFIDILKNRILLKRLLAMCYIWCVASLTYYVFIFNTGNLAGNRYLNFAIGAGLEMVVNVALIYILSRWTRKRPLIFCFVLVSVLCIVSGTIPKQIGDVDMSWVIRAFALFGKMPSAAIMALVFVYAAELFPTFARGSCLAVCGCSMRIGGMVAPQIIYLGDVVFAEFPPIVVAALMLVSVVLTVFLPETFGKSMPNTVEDALGIIALSAPKENHSSNGDSSSDASSDGTENEKLTNEGDVVSTNC